MSAGHIVNICIYKHVHTETHMYACMLSCFSHVQLFVTLWTVARQSSIHGILQERVLEWVALSSSRRSSRPGVKLVSLLSSALRWILYPLSHLGSPERNMHVYKYKHIAS